MSKINVDEFEKRLEALCLKKGGRGLPRKRQDQHILFKSIALILEPHRDYSESELNEVLKQWLAKIGQKIEIDHVTLRRHLVDEGYISRDRAGMLYKVNDAKMADLFEPETNAINPAKVIEKALKRKEQKKRQYLNRTKRN
ncbi:MAG: hypothetical protein DRP47_07490 [Candidatus Zixiibacteriota bacterium]|nr:MAG: hypothetical protein DRP47_07490 [candidate division Zixibacteria bacterium]